MNHVSSNNSFKPATRSFLTWVTLPTYALIGLRLGYLLTGSALDRPEIGGLVGAGFGLVLGYFARRAILTQYAPGQERAV